MPDDKELPTDEELAASAKRILDGEYPTLEEARATNRKLLSDPGSAPERDRFDDHPTDEELAYDAARVLGHSGAPQPDDEYPTAEERARDMKRLGLAPRSAPQLDEHPPTDEELAKNEKKLFGTMNKSEDNIKKLFGDNVVPIRSATNDDNSIEAGINAWNKIYATAYDGPNFKIIWEDENHEVIKILDKKNFIDGRTYDKVTVTAQDPNGQNIRIKFEPKTKLWLDHPKHRQYRDIIFNPLRPYDPIGGPGVDYNLWRDFAIKPIKGSCYPELRYIREVLCNGNKKVYRWVLAWVAHMMQRPWEKPETAIAIQGEEEGTGKSFFPNMLSLLLDGSGTRYPQLYFKASNSKMFTGDFTGHLERCLLAHAEEAFSAESNREDSIIKDLISGNKLPIHGKYKDPKVSRNYIRLILTGNPPHIVKAGRFARRFLVLNPSSAYRQNTQYFGRLMDHMVMGGLEALMYYLKRYPIFKFDLRVAPKTKGLLDQKRFSRGPAGDFWYNILYTGELTFDKLADDNKQYYHSYSGPQYLIPKRKVYILYESYCKKMRIKPFGESAFGRDFNKMFSVGGIVAPTQIDKDTKKPKSGVATDKLSDGVNYYVLPNLDLTRRAFDAWSEDAEDWPEDTEYWVDKPYG